MLRLVLLELGLVLARRIPFRVCADLGSATGWLAGWVSPVRGLVTANLETIASALRGRPTAWPSAVASPSVASPSVASPFPRSASPVFSAYGRYWGEFLALAARPERIDRLAIRVEGEDHLVAAAARGAVCIATGHLGNWDLGSRLAAQRLPHFAVMAEELAPPSLFRFFVKVRRAGGCDVIAAEGGGLRLFRHLRRGGHAGVLADRVFGSGTRKVPFLGGEREFPAAGLDLALRAGASVVPAFLIRDDQGYRLRFHPALPGNEDPVASFARALESEVRMFAGQWCLLYPLNSLASGTEPARVLPVKGKAATE